MLQSTLIYIDDVLLFFKDEESHATLLKQFVEIVHHYGSMLYESKMLICQKEIKFLGMIFADGAYTHDIHIVEELQKFLDGPLTRKQVQHFLGIVQYLWNFIPRVAQMTRPLQLMLKKDLLWWQIGLKWGDQWEEFIFFFCITETPERPTRPFFVVWIRDP